ncbi:MAG TPA: hypothetical protein VFE78_07085 [Gemmataceae bacterium]|nr:hypothetical protein [Gemmataceae bacterium]
MTFEWETFKLVREGGWGLAPSYTVGSKAGERGRPARAPRP